jgi:hypothetical protein
MVSARFLSFLVDHGSIQELIAIVSFGDTPKGSLTLDVFLVYDAAVRELITSILRREWGTLLVSALTLRCGGHMREAGATGTCCGGVPSASRV